MKKNFIFNNIMITINVALFLLLMTGNSFSFFEPIVKGNDESSNDIFIAGDYKLKLNKINSINFHGYPGESADTVFSLTNTGERVIKNYTVNLSEVVNSLTYKDQAYYLISCKSSTDECESKGQTIFPTRSGTILEVTNLDPGETHTFTFTVGYLLTGDDSQSSNNNGDIEFRITVDEVEEIEAVNLVDNILNKNGGIAAIVAKGTPSFSNATTNMGMYATTDTSGTSYYYRGAITDNYIEFAGFTWRIVRINGDGSIRIILNDFARNASGTAYWLRYNSSGNCNASNVTNISISNACVAYGIGSYASTSVSNTVNAWYNNNFSGIYLNYIKQDSTFCSDYSYYGGWAWTAYGPDYRLVSNKIPNLTCTAPSGYTSGSAYKLTLPVGLLTGDELAMAGAYYGAGNSSFYLYNGSTTWWTMSASIWGDPPSSASAVIGTGSTSLTRETVHSYGAIRPVINLIDTVMVTGSGTSSDPYKVIYY